MKRVWMFVLVAALLIACGCSYVGPSARELIAEHHGNAEALDAKIQAAPLADDVNAPLPAWIKAWSAEELRTWRAMVAWSKGQSLSPAPESAE